MSSPTHLTRSADWLITEINTRVQQALPFEISSFVRVFNAQDAFNQEFYKDLKIVYPFISYQTKSCSLSANARLGSAMSSRKGYSLANITLNNPEKANVEYITDETGQRIKQLAVWPIDLDVTLNFFTNTAQQYDEFLTVWFDLYPQIAGHIMIENSVELPITALPSVDRLEFPEKELDDKGEIFRGEFNAVIHTYAYHLSDIKAVRPSNNTGGVSAPTESPLTDKRGNIITGATKITISQGK